MTSVDDVSLGTEYNASDARNELLFLRANHEQHVNLDTQEQLTRIPLTGMKLMVLSL